MANNVTEVAERRRSVIQTALRAYKSETEQYLLRYKSWPMTSPYDPTCCATCRSEDARWREQESQRQALQQRLDDINATISEYQ